MHMIRSGLYWRMALVTWLRNSMVSSRPTVGMAQEHHVFDADDDLRRRELLLLPDGG